jgi:hypothetical protein
MELGVQGNDKVAGLDLGHRPIHPTAGGCEKVMRANQVSPETAGQSFELGGLKGKEVHRLPLNLGSSNASAADLGLLASAQILWWVCGHEVSANAFLPRERHEKRGRLYKPGVDGIDKFSLRRLGAWNKNAQRPGGKILESRPFAIHLQHWADVVGQPSQKIPHRKVLPGAHRPGNDLCIASLGKF